MSRLSDADRVGEDASRKEYAAVEDRRELAASLDGLSERREVQEGKIMNPNCQCEINQICNWTINDAFTHIHRRRCYEIQRCEFCKGLDQTIEELRQEVQRYKDAAVVALPEYDDELPRITWLVGKVRQLQLREQMVHELGRSYAEPKLENRALRGEIEELRRQLEQCRSACRELVKIQGEQARMLHERTL